MMLRAMGPDQAIGQAVKTTVTPAQPATPPKQHVVAQRETLGAIATRYGVSPEAIRRANPQLPAFVEPPVGMTLTLPEADGDAPLYTTRSRALSPDGGPRSPEPPTVDQAAKNLAAAEADLAAARQAVGQGNRASQADLGYLESAVTRARGELRSAIDRDVTASADARPTGSINDAAHVKREGAAIAARYAGDPATQAAIQREVAGLAIDREVADTKTVLLAQSDPAAMGRLMASELPRLSPGAQARLLRDPEIRRWIAGDFAGVDPSKITHSDQQREASAKADAFTGRLADVVSQLPPDQAEAVTRMMMPEIRKAGDGKLSPNDQESANARFDDLSRVAARLGDTPAADALVDEIADNYALVLGNGSFVSQTVHYATTGDGGPRLAVAVAENVQGRGDVSSTARSDIMAGVQTGIDDLRGQVDFNMQQYGAHMAKVDAASQSLNGLPGAEEARQAYIDSQPQAFKDKMNDLSGYAADSGNKLMRAIAGLSDMPPGLDKDTNLQAVLAQVGEDRAVQSALVMGAQKDPGALQGVEGKQVIEVLTGVKMGKEGTEFVRGYGSMIVGMNHAAALDAAARGDTARAKDILAKWADPAIGERLGMDPATYRGLTGKLDEVIDVAGDPAKVSVKLAEMRDMIDRGGELMAPDTNAGRLFRGLNLAASVSLAGKSLDEALKEGGWEKWLSAAGDSAGVLKDGTDLIAALAGKGAATGTKMFLGGFGALSVAADVGKIFTGDTAFDKGAAAISAMGGGFMLAAGLTGGPAGVAFAFIGASLTIIIEWAKGENEQKKQLMELNKMSGEALELLVEHGLDPAAIPELRRRGGDSGEFAAAPVLVRYLADRGYTPEEALAWINDAARQGKLDEVMNTAVESAATLGEVGEKAKGECDSKMDHTIRVMGLPLK